MRRQRADVALRLAPLGFRRVTVAYVFAGGRGKKEIVAQLAGFEGVLQVDGYAAYVSLAGDAKMSGKIRLAYCLVHARRNFVKVHKTTNSPFAREVIERIAAVYAIEERIRGLDAGDRRTVRQAETKPLMEALKARLIAVKDGISRQSRLIKAIDYILERWEGLTAFLDDGRLEPGRVDDWRGGGRLRGVAVVRRLSPRRCLSSNHGSVSSRRSSNRTCRLPASGFLPPHQTFALGRSARRRGIL